MWLCSFYSTQANCLQIEVNRAWKSKGISIRKVGIQSNQTWVSHRRQITVTRPPEEDNTIYGHMQSLIPKGNAGWKSMKENTEMFPFLMQSTWWCWWSQTQLSPAEDKVTLWTSCHFISETHRKSNHSHSNSHGRFAFLIQAHMHVSVYAPWDQTNALDHLFYDDVPERKCQGGEIKRTAD